MFCVEIIQTLVSPIVLFDVYFLDSVLREFDGERKRKREREREREEKGVGVFTMLLAMSEYLSFSKVLVKVLFFRGCLPSSLMPMTVESSMCKRKNT